MHQDAQLVQGVMLFITKDVFFLVQVHIMLSIKFAHRVMDYARRAAEQVS